MNIRKKIRQWNPDFHGHCNSSCFCTVAYCCKSILGFTKCTRVRHARGIELTSRQVRSITYISLLQGRGSCTWWSRQQALWLQRQVLVVPESLMQQWLKLSPLCPLRRTSLAMIPWGTLLCRSLRSGNILTTVRARRFLPNCWNWKNMKMDIRYMFGQKPTFYPEIPLILIVLKCEFCEIWDFRNVNFVKIGISELWILWKLRFQKGEFCASLIWHLR